MRNCRTRKSATSRSAGLALVCAVAVGTLLPLAAAAEADEFVIVMQHDRFSPRETKVPAGRKVKLIIDNRSEAIEEFESYDFDREKVIPPKSQATIFVGPLKPGRYQFVNEFNQKAPPGTLVVE